MFEPARRVGSGHGSDAVRRLIARPIRAQVSQARASTERAEPEVQSEAVESAPVSQASTSGLETELKILKAVLQSERRENANLRACLGFDADDETLGEEARAVRARWVALVDRLLQPSPR